MKTYKIQKYTYSPFKCPVRLEKLEGGSLYKHM